MRAWLENISIETRSLGCWKNLGNLQLQVSRLHLAAVFISGSRVLRAMSKLNPSRLTERGDHVNRLEALSRRRMVERDGNKQLFQISKEKQVAV